MRNILCPDRKKEEKGVRQALSAHFSEAQGDSHLQMVEAADFFNIASVKNRF